ncbi:hypothetical protein V2W45_1003244 [Cenococcum geophilum]
MCRTVPNGTLHATCFRSMCARISLCQFDQGVVDTDRHYRRPSTTTILYFQYALRSAAFISSWSPFEKCIPNIFGKSDSSFKELKKEFKRIRDLHLTVPGIDIQDKNLRIWETQTRGLILQPGKGSHKSGSARTYTDFWTVGEEQIFFQKLFSPLLRGCSSINNFRFALHWRKARKEPLPCMILFLVHETTNVARLVAQDQNGSTLAEAVGRSNHTCI